MNEITTYRGLKVRTLKPVRVTVNGTKPIDLLPNTTLTVEREGSFNDGGSFLILKDKTTRYHLLTGWTTRLKATDWSIVP
jgi:hypothetical protein